MNRPKIITFICIIGFISVMLSFPQVFSPTIKKIGMFAPAVYGAIIAMQFISYVGLWYFKQWGAQSLLITFFSKLCFNILVNDMGAMFYVYILISIFSFVFIFRHFKNMSPNF